MRPTGLLAPLLLGWLALAGIASAFAVPPRPTITVDVNDTLHSVYVAPLGLPVRMDVLVSVQQATPETFDLYIGAIVPGGRFASWAGNPAAPSLALGTAPVPLQQRVAFSMSVQLSLAHAFGGTAPTGWYSLYAILVPPGADPLDPSNWRRASFVPLLVTPWAPL